MDAEQLDGIIEQAGPEFRERIGELHARILEAATAAIEEYQDNDKKGSANVNIGFSLKLDVSKKPPTWSMEASVGVKFKSTGAIHQAGDTTPDLPGINLHILDDEDSGMETTGTEPPAKAGKGGGKKK